MKRLYAKSGDVELARLLSLMKLKRFEQYLMVKSSL